jgi:hypothetical protein
LSYDRFDILSVACAAGLLLAAGFVGVSRGSPPSAPRISASSARAVVSDLSRVCRVDIDSTASYNEIVKRRVAATTPKNGASHCTAVSPLGRDLSKIAERIASSGIKPLNRKEVAREVSERRGGR